MFPQFLSSVCKKRESQLKGGTRPWEDDRRNLIFQVSGLTTHTRIQRNARIHTLTHTHTHATHTHTNRDPKPKSNLNLNPNPNSNPNANGSPYPNRNMTLALTLPLILAVILTPKPNPGPTPTPKLARTHKSIHTLTHARTRKIQHAPPPLF